MEFQEFTYVREQHDIQSPYTFCKPRVTPWPSSLVDTQHPQLEPLNLESPLGPLSLIANSPPAYITPSVNLVKLPMPKTILQATLPIGSVNRYLNPISVETTNTQVTCYTQCSKIKFPYLVKGINRYAVSLHIFMFV